MEFEGRRVLVTGGTRGIGRTIVAAFLKSGAHVAVNGQSAESVESALAGLAASEKDHIVAAPGDVGTMDGCRAAVEAAVDGLGGLDVLVNNAGINRDGPFLEMTEADWDRVLDVNLKGPMLLTQLAAPAMRRGAGGRVVNVSAVTGIQARRNAVNYCVSKAGLLMLTKCAALELAPDILVNAIGLGFVRSALVEEHFSADQLATIVDETPVRRMGEFEEVADLVLFLASETTAFMTGQTVILDGGRIMR
ncbi:MAG: SDR family NAD(P)-dependent oxidoreductase [Alphaproteobacteria bacterium]|nr:SDR family NAD(P)-dependent oxidoreductase [Alphaproteobacteria bacterium]